VGEESGRLIVGTEGRKAEIRLQVLLIAHHSGRVETIVNYVGVGGRSIFEGEAALSPAVALRAYNEAVQTFADQGFEGLEAIPSQYAYEIAEAAAFVRLTGEEPELDGDFRLVQTPGRPDVRADVTAEMRGDVYKGFAGFVSFHQLRNGALDEVPVKGGVYVVLRMSKDEPAFLDESCGGHFKGKNPTELVEVLRAKWVAGTAAIYVGKGDNLRQRLKQYADFGAGRPVGHWGGRYIWQLADRDDLVVAWRPCQADQTAVAFESKLVTLFKRENGGRLPFANIADPGR
jgi:hypothetical protein